MVTQFVESRRDRGGAVGRVLSALMVAGALSSAVGCGAGDPRPKYVSPGKPDAELAVISSATPGYYVDEVDGARVDLPPVSGIMVLGISPGGSTVKVLPGERRLRVLYSSGNSRSLWVVVYNFLAGRQYAIGASARYSGLKITDRQTNTSVVID